MGEASVGSLLEDLQARVISVLGGRLIGLYLYGSAATGGFEPGRSDVDLLAATSEDVSVIDLDRLRTMHSNFIDLHPAWADRIEVIYSSVQALGSFKDRRSPIAVISPGEPLHFRDEGAGLDWLMNWHLVTHGGRTLFGPAPETFIAPTTQQEFINSLCAHVIDGETWMLGGKTRQAQSYVVLTLCRTLVAIHTGAHTSKREAAIWVKENMPQWNELVSQAIVWRTAPAAEMGPAPESFSELIAFFRFVREEAMAFSSRV